MALVFSIPGKTFLLGEYLALHGGPTLVALTQPYFELRAQDGSGHFEGIHAVSPAGKFLAANSDYFKKFDLSFVDPYHGRGGFGASTAQFLGVYSLWLYREIPQQDMEKFFDLKHLLDSYQQMAWDGQGIAPSGADLVGQLKGLLTFFEKRSGLVSVASWPFANLEFSLIHTGNKVPTHEHLKTLKNFSSAGLEKSFALVRESFETGDEETFVNGVNSYSSELKTLGFICEPTLRLLAQIRTLAGVLAVKGCGALGSDVLFAVTEKGSGESLRGFCEQHGLQLVATQSNLSAGLQMSVRENS